MKRARLAGAAGALLALAAGAVAAPQSGPGLRGGELRLAVQAEPKTLDPLLAQDEPSAIIAYLTGGRLVRLNRVTQEVEPELAASWKVGDRGRRLTFALRQGVRFSDSTPFRAADVCFTLKRLNELKEQSPLAETFRTEQGPVACRVDGEYTVSMLFPVAQPGAERLFDDLAIQSAAAKKEAAVLGPFVIREQRVGAYLVLARNPNYWKRDARGVGLPYLDSIRIEIQRNRDAELIRFRRGEYHMVNNLDAELGERLKTEMPGAVVDAGASLDTEQLWFNLVERAPIPAYKKEWFRSAEFRRAISFAIRRDDLVRLVFRGHATPAFGPVPPANRLWYNPSIPPVAADPGRALDLLGRAGFQLRDGVLRDRAGHAVEFAIVTNSGNKARERMATLIQQDLAGLGMQANVVPLDFPSLIDRMTRTFEYEACLLGLTATDLDPNGMLSVWLSSGASHAWNPAQKQPATEWEAEVDRLMLHQKSELDPRRRKADFDRVQQIAADQAPFIYLVNRNALVALSPALRNVQPAVLRPQTLWNCEAIYFASGAHR